MKKPIVNAIIGSPSSTKSSSLYNTVILKHNYNLNNQIVNSNTKYVIKHNFDLEGKTLIIPNNCILQFDGGSIKNGIIIGNNTILLFDLNLDKVLSNISLKGNFDYGGVTADNETLEFNKDGKLKLKLDVYTKEQTLSKEELNVLKEITDKSILETREKSYLGISDISLALLYILTYGYEEVEEIENPEFDNLIIDSEGRIIIGKRKDNSLIIMGKTY